MLCSCCEVEKSQSGKMQIASSAQASIVTLREYCSLIGAESKCYQCWRHFKGPAATRPGSLIDSPFLVFLIVLYKIQTSQLEIELKKIMPCFSTPLSHDTMYCTDGANFLCLETRCSIQALKPSKSTLSTNSKGRSRLDNPLSAPNILGTAAIPGRPLFSSLREVPIKSDVESSIKN
jgi:hypothetical protein